MDNNKPTFLSISPSDIKEFVSYHYKAIQANLHITGDSHNMAWGFILHCKHGFLAPKSIVDYILYYKIYNSVLNLRDTHQNVNVSMTETDTQIVKNMSNNKNLPFSYYLYNSIQ